MERKWSGDRDAERPCACIRCDDPCIVPAGVQDAICPSCREARQGLLANEVTAPCHGRD